MPFFGGGAGDYIIVGTNIKGGNLALPAVIGDNNMGLGNGAGQSVVNADRNIFIGNEAGKLVETQNDNTIIGQFAGNASVNTISDSTLIGSNLLAGLNSSVTDSLVMSRNGLIGSRFAASVFLHSGSANFFADLSNSIFVGSNQDVDGLTDTTLTDSVYVGMGGRFIATSVNLASSALVGTGHTIGGSLSNVFGIGKGLVFSAGNAIGIGKDMTVAGNEIRIGDASHTSVVIGGVTLTGATGSLFPDGAIVGAPGTEAGGINVGGVTYESAFKVSDIDGTNFAQTILHRHSTTLEPLIVGARSNSNTDAHANVTNGMGLFSVYAVGYAGSNYKIFGTEAFAADDTGTISDTSAPGKWTLSLTPDASLVPAAVITARNSKAVEFSGPIGVGGATPVTSGITFPAVAVASAGANTLDDYEEGTFTPTFTCVTPGDLAVTYSVQQGQYVKIGKTVFVSVLIEFTPTFTTASGAMRVASLPFVGTASSNGNGAACRISNWNPPANYYVMAAGVATSQSYANLTRNGVASVANATANISEITSGVTTLIQYQGFFEV